ncbi:uncharacterized protein LOC121726438 isoform X1 [Aricia agestis]|uniref:uncharacterized protein LOC121726438 isoform X1 n=1 Tax=Aricia agestis TaxID=91739 RepID=UPI001C206B26|nr:uncharacterized protein LOC121726438 isoform X1 [Aricia agestis]
MSKRFIYQQQVGDRKKAKLDVTAADHNFPLSQNAARSSEVTNEANTWGDDNDDEILLLASQACEEVYGGQDISLLPDYSIAMQPSSTSTQICEPVPSTSKSAFAFKKPITPVNINKVKESDRISSPLPGISSKVKNDGINISEDLILSDKICDNLDPNYAYRQLLQLQEENAKLKSENGKLMEKCVTKEGEASILRSQLKTCQVAVDNARIEKIQAQEKAQMEWSEKLLAANNQMQDLRTQLDFKNLEIISIKEKCKMLESSKVKLTQVTIAGNDISASQKLNSSSIANDNNRKNNRIKTISNAVQTDGKSHFLKLSTVLRLDSSNLDDILPLILEPTMETCSLLDFNEKLRRPVDLSQNKCRMLYAFHQLPSTPHTNKRNKKAKISLPSIYKDVASIIAHQGHTFENNIRLLDIVKEVLSKVLTELDTISQRMTSAFHKEMDEKYIEATNTMHLINKIDLISGRSIIKDEQGILARRLLAILVLILEDSKNFNSLKKLMDDENSPLIEILAKLTRMCILLDNTSTAMFYSGLLSSVLHLLDVTKRESDLTIVKNIIHARPMPFVSCQILLVLTHTGKYVRRLCTKSGNLKVDYDQGVLLYKNDSCTLQIIYKQIEAALKCAERKEITGAVIFIARNLLLLYNYISVETEDSSECECQLVLLQVSVHALKICSTYLLPETTADDVTRADARRICVGGASALSGQAARLNRLRYHRGLLLQMADVPEIGNILSEVLSTFQAVPEEPPVSYHSQAWIQSFQKFTLNYE